MSSIEGDNEMKLETDLSKFCRHRDRHGVGDLRQFPTSKANKGGIVWVKTGGNHATTYSWFHFGG